MSKLGGSIMMFLIDCNGECACAECMIEEGQLSELKELESDTKLFPEFYKLGGFSTGYIWRVRQRVDTGHREIMGVGSEYISEQIVDLLNNGTIKVEE